MRQRKTGPCFALAVVRCQTHHRASTIYPPSYAPYGRVAISPVDAQGELIAKPSENQTEPRQPDWRMTMFAGALDASAGRLWPEEAPQRPQEATLSPVSSTAPQSGGLDPTLRRRTQGRHLVFGANLLGIGPDIDEREREHIARVLSVPCLILNEAAVAFGRARLYVDEGRIVAGVLNHLRPRRGLSEDLFGAGVIAGLFGTPLRWDPGGARRSGGP